MLVLYQESRKGWVFFLFLNLFCNLRQFTEVFSCLWNCSAHTILADLAVILYQLRGKGSQGESQLKSEGAWHKVLLLWLLWGEVPVVHASSPRF